jgi:hypothetical protein
LFAAWGEVCQECAPNVFAGCQALEGDANYMVAQQHRAAAVAAVDGGIDLNGQQGGAPMAVVGPARGSTNNEACQHKQ